jgi:hypothetical protein
VITTTLPEGLFREFGTWVCSPSMPTTLSNQQPIQATHTRAEDSESHQRPRATSSRHEAR